MRGLHSVLVFIICLLVSSLALANELSLSSEDNNLILNIDPEEEIFKRPKADKHKNNPDKETDDLYSISSFDLLLDLPAQFINIKPEGTRKAHIFGVSRYLLYKQIKVDYSLS